MTAEWFTAAELEALALPGLPGTRRGIALAAEAQGWTAPEAEGRSWRRRAGRGGGTEFHVSVLPLAARAKLALAAAPQPTAREAARATLSHEEAWAWFERLPEKPRAEAARRLQALEAVQQLVAQGTPKVTAMQLVASERDIRLSTLYGWEVLVRGVPAAHRLPRLAPRHAGRQGMRADCDAGAIEWLKSHWLRGSRPTAEEAIRELRRVAPSKGWTLPSDRTLRRQIEAIDVVVATRHREGPEAAERMFPAQRRDKSTLHALEAVNCDGHKIDVTCLWPDGTKRRPVIWAIQDVYSGKVLAWRVDRSENTDAFRLAFGDMAARYGIPDHIVLDNTLAAANKTMSGGVKHRNRFTVKPEDALGILPLVGVQVHWAKIYHGQSKPVERAFGDWARDIARHPAFEGAYTGNSTAAKPHNYGERAVPIAEFLAVAEQKIAEHNARPGRTSPVCRGRSFDATFAESYAQAPITKATEAQRRMFLLAVESVTVRRDGSVQLFGNRYGHDLLARHIGAALTIRFDPDNLHGQVHLELLDGTFLCTADCIHDTGFFDTDGVRSWAQATKARRRGLKLQADAEKVLTAAQLARDLAAVAAAPEQPPETRVVRPIFGTAGNAALKAEPIVAGEQEASVLRAVRHAWGGPRLVAEQDPDDGV